MKRDEADRDTAADSGLKPFWVLIAIGLFLIFLDLARFQDSGRSVPYSEFLSDVQQGKVSEVTIGTDAIDGLLKAAPSSTVSRQFTAVRPPGAETPDLTQQLAAHGVVFRGVRESHWMGGLISWTLPLILLFAFWSFLSRKAPGGGLGRGGGLLSMGKSRARIFVETDLKTRFDDVAGVDEAKAELSEIVSFLKDPTKHSKLGGRLPKGVLLVGPPGTGKTLLARAVAGEAHVPFFSINGSEFVELFVGLGAARVRDLFEQARKQSPCIVFIDELDALGKARGISAITGSSNDEKEQTLNQLLAEMDGFDPTKGIVLLAATNRPEVLDPALLRAGRFDRSVAVDKPDRGGREKILAVHLKSIQLSPEVSLPTIASLTAGFSGADLANLANEAALVATRRKAAAVEDRDFTEAIERIVAGLERRSRLISPEEKRRVAYHEMGHAVVALALGEGEVIHKVSIIPRGIAALGYTFRRPIEDRYLLMRGELRAKIAIALGGRAAEMRFFNDVSTGAGDDLDKATDIARAMVARYGMSDRLGLAVYERETAPFLGGPGMGTRALEYSERTAEAIDQEIARTMSDALGLALGVIDRSTEMIHEAVKVLLTSETLDEATLKRLWAQYGFTPDRAAA